MAYVESQDEDLIAYLHAAIDEIDVTATSLIHACQDREPDGRLYLTALGLQALHSKAIQRLEALEAALERRGP
jgi:hypothetical protein